MQVGSALSLVTPVTPQVLGCGGTSDPVTAVRENLEVNVAILIAGDSRLAIVSLDLLYPGRLIREGVESGLSDIFAPHEIFIAASHTHGAPSVDIDKPLLGRVDTHYVDFVVNSVIDCVRRATQNLIDVSSVRVHSGYATSSINRRAKRPFRVGRRRLRFGEFDLGPNQHGPNNELVTAIVFGPRDAPLAVIWNYACHPTSAPLPYEIDSHFPGGVRANLRSHLSTPQLPVLFLQGFSGDIRPPALEKVTSLNTLLRRVLLGKRFGPFETEPYHDWVDGLSAVVLQTMSQPGRGLGDALRVARVEEPLCRFVSGAAPHKKVSFHGFCIDSLAVVGVSGEVVTEYSQRLQSQFPGQQAVGVGCIDDTYGYVPTASMLGTGGYEDASFCRSFGLDQVTPGVEQAMMQGFEAVSKKLVSPTR